MTSFSNKQAQPLAPKKFLQTSFFWSVFAAVALAFSTNCRSSEVANFCSSGIGEQRETLFGNLGKAQLNACTILFFDQKTATATLDGEAFFECENGQILKIKMPEGQLVLRSARAVAKTRPELFEIKIFEGQSIFEHPNGDNFKLEKGEVLTRDSTEKGFKTAIFQSKSAKPDWLSGFSSFEKEPLRNVFFEFERQFDTRVKLPPNLAALPFSGFFEHQNLEKALDQICRPMQLDFEKNGQKISIKKVIKK